MADDRFAKIRERAYLIWERENKPEGKHLEHWLCAEAEIDAELAAETGEQGQAIRPTPSPTQAAAPMPETADRPRRAV